MECGGFLRFGLFSFLERIPQIAVKFTARSCLCQSTVYAPVEGKVAKKLVNVGDKVEAKDLLLVLE